MKDQVNFFPAVNTMLQGRLNNPDFQQVDFSTEGFKRRRQEVNARCRCSGRSLTGCSIAEDMAVRKLHRPDLHQPTPMIQRLDRPTRPSTYISIRDDDGNEVQLGTAGENLRQGPAGGG